MVFEAHRVSNPYLMSGPTVISFSGGRTSGYMLRQILDAHSGTLPDDVKVVFCNTGKEMPETLDFVQECGEHWGVKINWLEFRWEPGRLFYEVVSHNSASRNGEPFEMLIANRHMLPNPVTRFCSIEMKIRTTYRWVRAELGWDHWLSVVGLRADEPRRVAKQKARSESGVDRFENDCPLATAGVTKATVKAWWDAQPFDLRLPNINGVTPAGNCDLCFLKSFPTLLGLVRDNPESADWWAKQEEQMSGQHFMRNSRMELFRADRPSYAATKKLAAEQIDWVAEDVSALDCACTD
jgi:3'-phosphoadenosine 5'-phosphosulfate sulfotransferase (PAPS reductase)/FAD synthetase